MSDEQPPVPDGPTSGAYGRSYGRPPVPGAAGPGFGIPPTSRVALAATITGAFAVVPCCWGLPVPAVAALVLGVVGRRQVAASGARQQGAGLALDGLVLGALGVLLSIVFWVLVLSGVIDTRVYVSG